MQERPTILPRQIADRLGEIRSLMKGLKAEDERLRQALLSAGLNGPIEGNSFQVVVRQRETRRFDRTRLPEEILKDARYWKTVISKTVITRNLVDLRRAEGPPRTRRPKPEMEMEMIEPW